MQELAGSLAQHAWAWGSVIALGTFHGVNPGMGWLFAVSNGMQTGRGWGVFVALPSIAAGHLLAMTAALLPFTLLGVYVDRLIWIQAIAALVLIAFGAYKLLNQKHPRFLARVGPSHLVLWSFLMATAHGAGLMLVPVVLGLYGDLPAGHTGHGALAGAAGSSLGLSLFAVTLHTAAMVVTGGLIAWVVYRFAGLAFLRRYWVNLDLVWALMLMLVGGIALATLV